MKIRHLARQAALQTLTSLLLNNEKKEVVLPFVLKEFAPQITDTHFLEEIIDGVLSERKNLDETISKYAPEWPVEKLDPVERTILEMGCYEILKTDTPHPVVINECVDLAKEFGDDTAGKFINGVLSSISKKGK